MADIRCPMCGRPNPEELDECIFCQARLRPLIAPQPPFSAEEPTPGSVQPPAPEEPPDWLAKIREQKPDEKPATDPFENLSQELSASEEVPDWLRSVRELTQKDGLNKEPPLGVPDLGVEPGSAEVDADWLQSLREVKDPGEESAPTEDQAASTDQVPDWLVDISESKTSADGEPGPDWLNGLRDLEEKPIPASDAEPPEAPIRVDPEDSLDWVRDMRSSVPLEPENEMPPADAPLATVEPPVVVPPIVPLQARKSKPRPARQSPPPVEPAAAESGQPVPPAEPQGPEWEPGWSPEWLSSIEAKAAEVPDQVQQPSPEEPAEGELPDWLSELGTARSARPVREERESTGEEEWIAPAELPNWVQEMRPVETVAPEPPPVAVREERIEERGPLAGLKNVLPSEPTATEIRRPPVYIPRLQVSERHQAHSELLSQLIASESEPIPAAQQPVLSTQRILRLVLAVFLLAAVLYPIVSGSSIFPIPSSVPQEVTWAYETVDSLGQNEAVLVAVDYEAGFSGELEAAGSAVIDHLMSKGARLALISTNPVGQALAERLMSSATSRSEPYMTPYLNGDQVVNLGYLPGGSAGLAGLVADPRQATYFDVLGRPAWDLPTLSGLTSITGFSQILVLTENVDTARAWFEQVGIALPSSSSLVLVTSAQAAPILRAYLDSGQVQGMVSGLTGGTAYERMRNRPGAARFIWDAYQMGTWAAVLLILGGSLVSFLWPMVQQRTQKTFKKEASL